VSVVVEEVTSSTPEVVAALNNLLPQLSSTAGDIDAPRVQAIIDSGAAHLLIARDGDQIVGTLTLVIFAIPTGIRAWVEDVVVDSEFRGNGVGQLLTAAALERARRAGARTVELTSRSSRDAANRLYQRLGFAMRETNVYRRLIKEDELE
jgi:ribosomal protein S18 acetylase RimI-like enzyme